jgi:aspartokinase
MADGEEEVMTKPPSSGHASRPWVTLKYGGTSVSFERTWKQIAARVEELLPNHRVVLVLSALSQVQHSHA